MRNRTALGALALLACAATPLAQGELFRDLRVDQLNPSSVVVADYDGDGLVDVVTRDPALIVLLGNGDGTFTPGFDAFPQGVNDLFAHDVDLDGVVDLVGTQTAANEVIVYLGLGDGSFVFDAEYGTAKGPSDVSFADVDGDGDTDLVVACEDTIRTTLLFNDGTGHFPTKAQVASPGDRPHEVEVGDLDGDGAPDLVVANFYDDTVSVLLNAGGGVFPESQEYPTGQVGFGVESLRLVDLDADGHLDVLVLNAFLTVWWGDGTGVLGAPVSFPTGAASEEIAVHDVDEDGDLDLVLANGGHPSLGVLLQQGPRNLGAPRLFGAGTSALDLAVVDVDGDGDADVIAGHLSSEDLVVVTGNGDGSFGPHQATIGNPLEVVLADFDGDGRLDLASVSEAQAQLSVVLAEPGGGVDGLQMQPVVGYATGAAPVDLVAGDFTGDGAPDLAVVNAGFGVNRVELFVNAGDGSFGAPLAHAVGSDVRRLVAEHMDADAHLDLVVMSSTERVDVLLGQGDGSFVAGDQVATWFAPVDVATGDFDGDGHADVVTNHNATTTELQLRLGNGDGTLGPALDVALGNFFVGGHLAVGDVDGDGDADVLGASGAGLGLCVLRGDGAGGFGPVTGVPYSGQDPLDLALGDVDGDGDLDAVVANEFRFFDRGSFTLHVNPGDGSFGAPVEIVSGRNATGIALGDLDLDGFLDVALASEGSGFVSLLRNQAGPWQKLRGGLAGELGIPRQEPSGTNAALGPFGFQLSDARPGGLAFWVLGLSELGAPFKGGTLVPSPDVIVKNLPIDGAGDAFLGGVVPVVPAGLELWYQFWIPDPAAPVGFAASNAVKGVTFD